MPVSQEVSIPIELPLAMTGRHRYVIDSMTDALGNAFEPSLSPHTELTARSVEVIQRGAATFKNCGGNSRSIALFKDSSATLTLSIQRNQNNRDRRDASTIPETDSVKSVSLRYDPPSSGQSSNKASYTKEYSARKSKSGELSVQVKDQGTYTIVAVNGRQCAGEVLSPEICKVVEQPLPSAEVTLQSIQEW